MKLKSVARLSMAALFCVPVFASTYFGGVEASTSLDNELQRCRVFNERQRIEPSLPNRLGKPHLV